MQPISTGVDEIELDVFPIVGRCTEEVVPVVEKVESHAMKREVKKRACSPGKYLSNAPPRRVRLYGTAYLNKYWQEACWRLDVGRGGERGLRT